MASISAKFRLIDEMSAKLDKIAQSGRNAMSQWEKAGAAIDTAFDGAVAQTAQTARTIDTSAGSVENFGDAAMRAADRTEEYATAMSDMENATNAASAATNDTEEALDEVARSADRAGEKVEDFGEESEEAGRKSKKFGDDTAEAMESIENLLVTVGITKLLEGIGNAFVSCVEDAIEFESAITGVYKTVDGTPEQLAAISEEVKELSLRIPSTTTEIAAVAEAAGQLGIATEDVMSFTEVMINLGEATNLSSDEAASSLAKFTNITGTTADEYENLGSTIVALGNNFATTEADIVAMSTRMASAGTLAGLTESDILALAASISSVGIEADAGGSSMSTLLSKMQLAVETGNDSLEQFASVAGYSADEFAQKWGEDAAGALYAFIDGLNDTARNGASATAVLDEMGITEIRLSNAIKALANNSDNLGQALNFASDAWKENNALATEANTRYATLESKLAMTKNAANNLSMEIGNVFTPTVEGAATVGQNVLEGLTVFVKENPAVVKGIAALAIGVTTFTGAIVAYTVATKAAKVAQAALNAIQMANPYYLVGAAIAAVTVGLIAFASTMIEAEEEQIKMTATSEKQAKELEDLRTEYDRACETYGEASYQAQELSWQIEELNATYEDGKQTLEDYISESEQLNDAMNERLDKNRETYEAAELEEEKMLNLVHRLADLADQNDKTIETQQEMKAIINELNDVLPGLSLNYEDVANGVTDFEAAIEAMIKAEAATQKYEAAQQGMVDAYNTIHEAEKSLSDLRNQETLELEKNAKLLEEYESIKAKYDARNGRIGRRNRGRNPYTEDYREAKAAYEASNDALAEYDQEISEHTATLNRAQSEYDKYMEELKEIAGVTETAAGEQVDYETAVTSSLQSVQAEVNELCKKYDEAYLTARESIDGQIGLFDEMVVEVEKTTAEMLGAWESQILYLNSYTENLKKAMDFGLDRSLVQQLSDGSTESAANLDTIISKIESLGGTTDAAKKFVDDFNKKFQEVETAKDEFAGQVADIETNFSDEMEKIEERLNTAIDNMNMQDDAAAAAKATMSGYIQEIIAGGNSAVAAAADAAARVKAALESGVATTASTGGWNSYEDAAAAGYSNIRTRSEFARGGSDKTTYGTYDAYLDAMYEKYVGYAEGTDYATPGIHLVGEEGPELVEFGGGEIVHTAEETADILNGGGSQEFYSTKEFYAAPESDVDKPTTQAQDGGTRTIRLEIDGSGAIEIDGSMDEETVVAILQQHLKPVLTGIVKQEIYEEGDLAYDF